MSFRSSVVSIKCHFDEISFRSNVVSINCRVINCHSTILDSVDLKIWLNLYYYETCSVDEFASHADRLDTFRYFTKQRHSANLRRRRPVSSSTPTESRLGDKTPFYFESSFCLQ